MTPINVNLEGGKAALTRPLDVRFKRRIPGYRQYLRVPAGFRSDGYSFPRILLSVLGSPFADPIEPAVAHDWMCEKAQTRGDRLLADAALYCLLEDAGVVAWRRTVFFLGVRAYAILCWRSRKHVSSTKARLGH